VKISVITPLYAPGNAYIGETYRTLMAQTCQEWEWIIVENNGGRVPHDARADGRVRVLTSEQKNIGALKRLASMAAESEYVVELDNDDLLAPEALDLVLLAFADGADFVYSDAAEFKDGTWEKRWSFPGGGGYPYGAAYGWKTYDVMYDGHPLIAMSSPPVTPQNIRLVDWSPNHVRAWRMDAYRDVGGHDASMAVIDDHDLVVRFFLAGKKFKHIPQCLYFYRVHEKNTVGTRNAQIRDATWGVYNRSVYKLAEKFAMDAGLELVDLCGGVDTVSGYLALDQVVPAGIRGIACDLDKAWPLADSSVGIIRAADAVEHLRDPIHTMNEAWRVLAPGGWLMIDVPSTNGKGAFCDPTHCSFWNDLSFRYYTDAKFARYVPAFKGRFQAARVIEWFPSDWHKENNVPYVQAHLICLKPGYEPMGGIGWPRQEILSS